MHGEIKTLSTRPNKERKCQEHISFRELPRGVMPDTASNNFKDFLITNILYVIDSDQR